MLARAIHLLMIPAIFGCPLFCTGGAGGVFANCCDHAPSPAKSDHARPAPCCAGHAGDLAQTPDDEPAPSDERPADHACQCICGGAILGDTIATDELQHAPLAFGAVALPTPSLNLPRLGDSAASQLFLRIDDLTAVSGRQLRQLHMSLLC